MRELQEETQLCALRVDYLFQFWGARTRHFIFIAHLAADAQPRPDNEIARCRWTRLQGVRRLPTSISTKGIAIYMACAPALLGNRRPHCGDRNTSALTAPSEAHDVSHGVDESNSSGYRTMSDAAHAQDDAIAK
jgi:8-oxo-dGTP diphosphatase